MNALKRRFNRLVDAIHRPIAIFVDDLDRCRADYVVDLLEGVQTSFREASVSFVVAADRHWLYDAYGKIYGDYVKTGIDPGRPLGHLFLEKSFQLSTSVPKISLDEQRAFWERLLFSPEEGKRPNLEELARRQRRTSPGWKRRMRSWVNSIVTPAKRRRKTGLAEKLLCAVLRARRCSGTSSIP